MEFDSGRRRFLELTTTGTALSLAGCSALEDQGTTGTDSSATEETSGEGRQQRVAVSTPADRQQLQQRQQEIQANVSSGNISRSEAQQRYQTAQQELRSSAVASFKERASSTSGLTVVDSLDQFGVLLVSGTPTVLIETLSLDPVNALLPADTFQQAKTRVEQQRNSTSTATGSD